MSESNQATSSATTTTTLGGGCWDVWGIVLFPLRVLLGCTAFGMGACFNLCCDCGKSRRDKKPDWEQTKDDLSTFLQESGIGEELQETASRGKFRLFANLRLLHVLQRKLYPRGRPEACKMGDTDDTVALKDAGTFMKFATAAYGPQVIANAIFESGERVPPGPLAKTRPAVLKHVGIKDDEDNVVVVMNLAHGEDVGTLRHYAVVDHARKALVLAIRGTYSWSSTMANCAGFTTEFYNIEAHAGMVRLARGVWDASGPAIVQRFNDLPADYEFVITGHSLGAGVAGLINLLVHHEEAELRDSRSIRCFLYGGPPTISQLSLDADEEAGEDLVAKAVACTTCVVFKRDIVPFISVHAIRRLLSMAQVVDDLRVPLWKKPLLDHEIIQPSNELVESFQRHVDLPSAISGAPPLYIPARAVVWIDEEKQSCCCSCQHSYSVTLCDPRKLVDVGPLVGPSGISDHLTGRYEYSLQNLS